MFFPMKMVASHCLKLSVLLILSAASFELAHAETLADAWAETLDSDLLLKASRSAQQAADAQLEAARAHRRPSVEITGGYTQIEAPPSLVTSFGGLNAAVPFLNREFSYLQAGTTVPLYTSGRIDEGVAAARSGREIAGHALDVQQADIKLAVAEDYINVLRARRTQKVANIYVRNLNEHLKVAENMYAQGLAARNAVLAASVAAASAQETAIRAMTQVELAQASYNRRLGRPLDAIVELEEPLIPMSEEPLGILVQRALANRSELSLLDAQEQALRASGRAEIAALKPQIGLSTSYSYLQNDYLMDEDFWSVSVQLRWKFFDGGTAKSLASAAGLQADQVRYQRQDAASLIELEVRQAWLELSATQKRIEVAQQAVVQAEESLRITQNRFPEGLSTNADVLDAVSALADASANLAMATYDAAIASLRLKRVAGDL